MSIQPKELSKIGYTNDIAKSLAIGIVKRHCKHDTKEQIKEVLTDILEYPEKYKDDEVWGKLSDHFAPTPVNKQFTVYNLFDEPLSFKTYGNKFIGTIDLEATC